MIHLLDNLRILPAVVRGRELLVSAAEAAAISERLAADECWRCGKELDGERESGLCWGCEGEE